MKGRSWQSEKYRYGFNGKENDGDGGFQDYGMRVNKEKIGRFMSVDPITAQYPELTPYQFASNTPIQAIDLDGLEGTQYIEHFVNRQGKAMQRRVFEMDVHVAIGEKNGYAMKDVKKIQDTYAKEYKNGQFKDNNGLSIVFKYNICHFDVNIVSVDAMKTQLNNNPSNFSVDVNGNKVPNGIILMKKRIEPVIRTDADGNQSKATIQGRSAEDITAMDVIINTLAENPKHTQAHETLHRWLIHTKNRALQPVSVTDHYKASGLFIYKGPQQSGGQNGNAIRDKRGNVVQVTKVSSLSQANVNAMVSTVPTLPERNQVDAMVESMKTQIKTQRK
jgi:RHS repeat-associated protein